MLCLSPIGVLWTAAKKVLFLMPLRGGGGVKGFTIKKKRAFLHSMDLFLFVKKVSTAIKLEGVGGGGKPKISFLRLS